MGPGLSVFLIAAIGGIAFSQGGSFACWDEFHPISHFINFHAILISALGLGLLFCQALLGVLIKRIDELEKTVNQLKK